VVPTGRVAQLAEQVTLNH